MPIVLAHVALPARVGLCALLVVLTGCAWGTRPGQYRPAVSPVGAPVEFRFLNDRRLQRGELFAVDSLGAQILTNGRLASIEWDDLGGLVAMQLRRTDFSVAAGTAPDETRRAAFARVSRFPQGLTGPLLAQVLATLEQDRMDRLPATRSLDSLADLTAREIARFADRRVAIAEGYRRVGPDFPGMGEHWVHPASLISRRIEASRPTLLAYATIDGQPRLLGAGFMLTTQGDEPVSAPGGAEYWHEHSGMLADESAGRRTEPRASAPGTRTTSTRVWVLHVWTALENPSCRYDADNWMLPFVRAGLTPPASVDAELGRAVSLAVGGDDFLRRILTDAGLRHDVNARLVDAMLASAVAEVSGLAAEARRTGELDVPGLRAAWSTLHAALREEIGAQIDPVFAHQHLAACTAPAATALDAQH